MNHEPAAGKSPHADDASNNVAGERRGALRFREVWTKAHLKEAPQDFNGIRPRLPLPRARSFSLLPYLRPFTRRRLRQKRTPGWESEAAAAASSTRASRRNGLLWWAVLLIAAGVLVGRFAGLGKQALVAREAPVLSNIERAGKVTFDARPELERTLRGFLDAKTAGGKSSFIRGGRALLPRLQEYYTRHDPEPPLEEITTDSLNWVESDGHLVVYGLLVTRDGSPRQFAAEVRDGRCLLDWQSLTGWTGTDWQAFLETQPAQEMLLCVSAVPDTLYAGPFLDAAEWLCFRLEDVSRLRAAWGYVSRQSSVAESLPFGLRTAAEQKVMTALRRLTLRLRFGDAPASSDTIATPLLEITGVAYEGWFDRHLASEFPP